MCFHICVRCWGDWLLNTDVKAGKTPARRTGSCPCCLFPGVFTVLGAPAYFMPQLSVCTAASFYRGAVYLMSQRLQGTWLWCSPLPKNAIFGPSTDEFWNRGGGTHLLQSGIRSEFWPSLNVMGISDVGVSLHPGRQWIGQAAPVSCSEGGLLKLLWGSTSLRLTALCSRLRWSSFTTMVPNVSGSCVITQKHLIKI